MSHHLFPYSGRSFISKRVRRTLLTTSLACVLTILPVTSQAGLKEAMNEMFHSTSTATQGIQTQRLRGIYGGSMTLRPVGRGVNIVQFAAPKIDAGCGGIDIFFGSFSWISGEQFEQLLRSLASAAVGYAIKAAIQSMCDPCAAILTELEAAIRELNSLAKNTCAIANAMFSDNGFEKLAERASNIGRHLGNAAQMTADWAAGENKRQAEKPKETAESSRPDQNPAVGNLVWRAANQTMDNGANTLTAFLTKKEAIEMIMGLFGTVIVLPDANSDDGQHAQANACGAGVTDERCDRPAEIIGPTIPNWETLFFPRKYGQDSFAGTRVLRCNNDTTCNRPSPALLPLSSWGGLDAAINVAMFGTETPDTVGINGYTADSLVGSIIHGSTGSLSHSAQRLSAVSPIPIQRFLLEVQKSKGAVDLLGREIARVLPEFFAYQIGVEFLAIGKNISTKQTEAVIPQEYKDELREKSKTLESFRPNIEAMMALINDTSNTILNVQRFTNSSLGGHR